MMWLDFWEF